MTKQLQHWEVKSLLPSANKQLYHDWIHKYPYFIDWEFAECEVLRYLQKQCNKCNVSDISIHNRLITLNK